jgi:chromosome segregation ATPase
MRTVEELEALLETVTRERDVETNSALMFECDWKDACRERDEARAEVEVIRKALMNALPVFRERNEAIDEVERLQVACHAWAEDMREAGRLCEQAGNEMPIDAVRRFVSSKTAIVDMLEDRFSESRSEVDRLTDERDELLVRVEDQGAELRATREVHNEARTDVPALIARVRELEAECERMKTFAAQNFSAMIRQEAEQMREYGLSYEGVRKVLHEYNDGEISFGKLMDLIRAAARAMAEDMQK